MENLQKYVNMLIVDPNVNDRKRKMLIELPDQIRSLFENNPEESYEYINMHDYFIYIGDGIRLKIMIGMSVRPLIYNITCLDNIIPNSRPIDDVNILYQEIDKLTGKIQSIKSKRRKLA